MSFQGKEVIGLIPARGGSKGIPRKNLVDFAGAPLISHTVQAALDSERIDRVIVSSDDPEILETGQNLGADPLLRPMELATDDAPSRGLIGHAIAELGHGADYNDPWYVLLQPTSPLRSAQHIDRAFQSREETKARGLVSVVEPAEHPMKAFVVDEDGFLVGIWGEEGPYQPRQSLPQAYFANGAIYIFRASDFKAEGRIPVHQMMPFLMDAIASIDIDSPADLVRAASLVEAERHV